MDFKCPTCGKAIPSATSGPDGKRHMNAKYFPFCSERCRLVDLGLWMDERYRIPAHGRLPADESLD